MFCEKFDQKLVYLPQMQGRVFMAWVIVLASVLAWIPTYWLRSAERYGVS